MRSNHITVFVIFIVSLIFHEFLLDIFAERLFNPPNPDNRLDFDQINSLIRFMRLSFISVYLFSLFYLLKYLRGHILIKGVPFILVIHLLANNPNLTLIESPFSLGGPYVFSLISAGVVSGLLFYSEREYLYNFVETSVHAVFDTILDVVGFLALIVIPLLVGAGYYGFVPYFIIDLFAESAPGLLFIYFPLFIFILMGIFVVVYQAPFQSFYLYRLIILIGLNLIYSLALFLGDFGSDALFQIHRLSIWVLAIIYLLYLDQVSLSPLKKTADSPKVQKDTSISVLSDDVI